MHMLAQVRSELLRLKWYVAATRFQIAMRKHAMALKAGFNPDQPRDDWGRWTDGGGGSLVREGAADEEFAGDEGLVEDDEAVDGDLFDTDFVDAAPTDISTARRRPGIGHNQGPPINDPSDIPPERPESAQERNRIAQEISRNSSVAAYYLTVIAVGAHHWLHEKYWEIKADQDAPKTLEELHDAVSRESAYGYDVHHVVEKASARNDGFRESLIEGRDNKVLLPRYKHWKINSWYQTPNEDYGGSTPRQYLHKKSWDERRDVGLKAMRDVGVLKP